MALGINTNIASLIAQRNLTTSADKLSVAVQRLSSGLRINSAKDDAAGLGISERMTSQIRGLDQAARNANDGVSLAQTAEGALAEVANNLQRIRELAVQAANSTNSAADRAALDAEVQQRIAEIDRTASTASFNNQKILDGTFGSAAFQVGANAGETISVSLSQGVRTTQIGQIATGTSSAEVTTAALSGTGTIQVGSNSAVTIGASTQGTKAGQTVGSAYAKALAINAASVPGLTATATNNVEFGIAATSGTATTPDTYSLRINGQDIYASYDQGANGVLSAQQITDAINAQSSNTGVTASLSGANLRLSAADGRDIIVGQTFGGAAAGGISAGAGGSTTVNGVVYRDGTVGTVANATAYGTDATAVNGGTITLSAQDNVVNTNDGLKLGFASDTFTLSKDTTTISSISVTSVTNANNAILRVDAALSTVSSLRGTYGSIQNRFGSVVASLMSMSENLSAARSRILDADFAAETASLTKASIAQQSGVAMLAQANALPQQVLALLRG